MHTIIRKQAIPLLCFFVINALLLAIKGPFGFSGRSNIIIGSEGVFAEM
jgi:hypothetical protein